MVEACPGRPSKGILSVSANTAYTGFHTNAVNQLGLESAILGVDVVVP